MIRPIKEFFEKYKKQLIKGGIVMSILLFFWIFMFNIINVHEVTLNRNLITSEVVCDTIPGIKFSAPWIQVSQIDTRPMRLCIDCSCTNLTCVLVSFDPKGYESLIQKEGWGYYWWRNRISFNFGNKNEYRGMENLLRGYAFDVDKYKFLKYE